jgi:hypothetical protein
MTPIERRSSLSLAFIYALRMLGLFLVLPVFALEAARSTPAATTRPWWAWPWASMA